MPGWVDTTAALGAFVLYTGLGALQILKVGFNFDIYLLYRNVFVKIEDLQFFR